MISTGGSRVKCQGQGPGFRVKGQGPAIQPLADDGGMTICTGREAGGNQSYSPITRVQPLQWALLL